MEFLHDDRVDYSTHRELFDAVQSLAHEVGFALRIQRSESKRGRIEISCDRAGVYTPSATKRSTRTKRTGCSFLLRGKLDGDKLWSLKRREGEHNHSRSEDIEVHPTARKLTDGQRTKRIHLEQSGIKPKEQLAFFRREYPSFHAVQQDLYNDKQTARVEFLNGGSSIQALVDVLHQSGYRYESKTDAAGHVTHLLFGHPTSIAILRQHHSVLQFGCTYKTNKLKLPLLLCTGVTPAFKSFLACGIFIKREEQSNYEWAL